MQRIRRWSAFAVVIALVLPVSAVAWAGEEARHLEQERVAITDEAPPEVTPDRYYGTTDADRDRVRDQDRTGVTDTQPDVEPDRPRDRITDRIRDRADVRCVDRVVDRHRCCPDRPVDYELPEWCRDHEPPETDVNIRQLIWRLIHAGEWGKLVRLLHRLHII